MLADLLMPAITGIELLAWAHHIHPLAKPKLIVPGIFAADDVRHRSAKRVAVAAGEGALVQEHAEGQR